LNAPEAGCRTVGPFPWPQRSYPGKRVLDVVLASLLLLPALPVMLLIALAVRLTSPGPVFFRGERSGLKGRKFRQLKFRSMRTTSLGGTFTTRDDCRVTAVGRLLRFAKLDELPQLLNVLRGDMSIVGPRPEDAVIVREHYTREQLRVLSVRPGITGLLQVRVFPDFTYSVPDGVDPQQYYLHAILPARLKEDLEYVDRMSVWLDVKVVLLTVYCILVKSWFILWGRWRKAKIA
jgi:lipopolysaccharide/colanic/teichoic acid biosynthesis glycosyltransferase